MAATKASMAALTLQRDRHGGKTWEAIAGKLIVASAMSLDTLVSLLTERHGGVLALINTAHVSKPQTLDISDAKIAPAPRAYRRRTPLKKPSGNVGTRRGQRARK